MNTGTGTRTAKSVAVVLFCIFTQSAVRAQISLDLETGWVNTGYNRVRIPGDAGTRFSLSDDLHSDDGSYWRARLGYSVGPRHHASILIAPLTIKAQGTVDRDILFEDRTFPAGTPLRATYRFDSYRATYRYDWVRSERLTAGIGFTGKIRDAAIVLKDGAQSARNTNTGFVPLLHARVLWHLAERTGLLVEADALAAPQGRAEDVLVALSYECTDRVRLRCGYRLLEGGADNDKVYTFALFHYFVAGLNVTF